MENYNDDKDCQYTEKICLMNIDDVWRNPYNYSHNINLSDLLLFSNEFKNLKGYQIILINWYNKY